MHQVHLLPVWGAGQHLRELQAPLRRPQHRLAAGPGP